MAAKTNEKSGKGFNPEDYQPPHLLVKGKYVESLYAKCGRWHPEVDWLCIPIPTKICEVIPIPDNF